MKIQFRRWEPRLRRPGASVNWGWSTNDADAGSVAHVADAASIGVLKRAPPN
jgi:hypothetical protein